MGHGHALASALLLAVGCGRIGYPALDDRDGGGGASDTGARDALVLDAPARDAPVRDAPAIDAPLSLDGAMVDGAMVDGATLDTGMLDTGATLDAGPMVDAGPAGCGFTAVFCDDFEGPTFVPPWSGTIAEPDTSLSRTTTVTRVGTGALMARTSVESRSAFVYTSITPAVTGPTIYMRAYVRVDTTLAHHLDLLQLNAGADSIAVMTYAGNLQVYDTFDLPSEIAPATPYPLPLGRYLCIEMGIRFHATAGAIDVWVDGTQVFHAEGIPTFTATRPVDQARVGASWAGAGQPPVTVYVDEVVIATDRVRCI